MQILKNVDPKTATGESQQLFGAVEHRLQRIPNMIQAMANSPAILAVYLHFNEAFEKTKLKPQARGLIAVAVSEINGCDYTLSTAMALGRFQGLSEAQLTSARRAEADDPQTNVALRFAARVVRKQGRVEAADTLELRQAGFDDQEIVEIIAAIALNVFRNYFNLIARTEIDFPVVRASVNNGGAQLKYLPAETLNANRS